MVPEELEKKPSTFLGLREPFRLFENEDTASFRRFPGCLGAATPGLESMSKRVVYGWALFFSAVCALLAGGLVWAVFLGGLSIVGSNEYIDMMRKKGVKPSPRIVRSMSLAFYIVACAPTPCARMVMTASANIGLRLSPCSA